MSAEAPPPAPSWPPGESPLRARGRLYEAARAYYRAELPGGLAAVENALEPAVRAFFDRPFAATRSYDLLPLLAINRAAARVSGLSPEEQNRRGARFTAERDLGGLSRLLLKLLAPETVALKLAVVAMRYFDFGRAESRLVAPGRCRVAQLGVPIVLAEWLLSADEGFALVALERTGGRDPGFRAEAPALDGGALHGLATATLAFELTWR